MRIHCDNCGVEFEKDAAVLHTFDGEVFYFCCESCYETSEYLDPLQYPDEEKGAAPGPGPGSGVA